MDETTNIRLTAIETRLAAIEARLSALEQSSTAAKPRRRKELSPEERQAIRARLVEGKRKKQELAEATLVAAAAEAAKPNKKKEVKNGTS